MYDIHELHHSEYSAAVICSPWSLIWATTTLTRSIMCIRVSRAAHGSISHSSAIFGDQALNGQIPEVCNRRASDLAAMLGKAVMGGSDAHTMAALGRTYTAVSGARNKDEFISGLRHGQASLHGESGNYWKLTGAVIGLASKMMRERPWTLSLSPLFPLVPAVTLANYFRELAFVYQWSSRTLYRTSASVCAAGWRNPQESTEAGS